MARLDAYWAAVATTVLAAVGLAAGATGVGFFVALGYGSVWASASIAGGLVLIAGLLAPRPDIPENRPGIVASAVSPARLVYGIRRVPMQLVGVIEKTTEEGDDLRGMVLVVSEGATDGPEALKVNGETYSLGLPTTLADGGIRYSPSAYFDLVYYGAADGTQGAAIRDFSARRDFVLSTAVSGINRPSELPGGDARSAADPFTVVSNTTAKPVGDAPSQPDLYVEWDDSEGLVAIIRWSSPEDPDIKGLQVSLLDSNKAADPSWMDITKLGDYEEDQAGDPVFVPDTQSGSFELYRETDTSAAVIAYDEVYDVALRSWREDANGNRVYSTKAGATLDTDDGGTQGRTQAHTVWTEKHQLYGLSYVFIQLRQPVDENYWRSQPDIQLTIRGRKISWPGQSTPIFTRNAVAHAYDLLREQGFEASEIHDQTIRTEYAYANESLTLTTAEEASLAERGYGEYAGDDHIRYSADFVVQSTDNMEAVWQNLLAVMGEGTVYPWQGQWYVEVGRSRTPYSVDITEDDLESLELAPGPPIDQRYNAVRLTLDQSSEHDYEAHSIEYIDTDARDNRDFGKLYLRDIGTLPALTDPIQAQRLAATILRRGRANLTLNGRLKQRSNLEWLNLRPNRVARFDLPSYGFTGTNKLEARSARLTLESDWKVSVIGLEEDSDIWSDDLILPEYRPREVGDPLQRNVPAVTGLSLDEYAFIFHGVRYIFIQAEYDDDETGIPVRLRWRLTALPGGIAVPTQVWAVEPWDWPYVYPAIPTATYEVQAQHGYPGGGYTGDWSASVTRVVGGDLDPPPSPENLIAEPIQGGYALQWMDPRTPAPGASEADENEAIVSDISHWSVSHSEDTSLVFPPAGSYQGGTRVASFVVDTITEATTLKVWVRTVDLSGNASEYASVQTRTLRKGTSVGAIARNVSLDATVSYAELTWDLPLQDIPEHWRVQFGLPTATNAISWGTPAYVAGTATSHRLTSSALASVINKVLYARIQPATKQGTDYVLGGSVIVNNVISLAALDPPVLTTQIYESRLDVSWLAITGASGYDVDFGQSGGDWVEQTRDQSALFYSKTGLTNGTVYAFRVRAVSAGAQSIWTVTPPLSPNATSVAPGVPRNLTATADPDDDTQIDVDWDPPTNTGSVPNGISYEILHRVRGSNAANTITASSGTSKTLTGLTDGVEYEISVRAKNSVGTGAATDLVYVTAGLVVVPVRSWAAWPAAGWTTATFFVAADIEEHERDGDFAQYGATTAGVVNTLSSGLFGKVKGTTSDDSEFQVFQNQPTTANRFRYIDVAGSLAWFDTDTSLIELYTNGHSYRTDGPTTNSLWAYHVFQSGLTNQPPSLGTQTGETVRGIGFIVWIPDSDGKSGEQTYYQVTSGGYYRISRRYE